jgi:hypothetical protein
VAVRWRSSLRVGGSSATSPGSSAARSIAVSLKGRTWLSGAGSGWPAERTDVDQLPRPHVPDKELLTAAEDLHHAVRAALDPEAFSDFHGDHPFIELRDPADITRP